LGNLDKSTLFINRGVKQQQNKLLKAQQNIGYQNQENYIQKSSYVQKQNKIKKTRKQNIKKSSMTHLFKDLPINK